ncbi:MAG: SDR family NAD(P)-dependent oxidoreductase [Pseudomonadota bacterium]
MTRFEGRRAVVTGAASGMGAAIARRLKAEGADVLGVDQAPADLTLDVAAPDAAAHIVAAAVKALGGIDILIPAAGIVSTAPTADMTDDVWDRTMNVNLGAIFRLSRAAIPYLKESAAGRIVTIGSIMSSFGDAEFAAYAASKHGVLGLTKVLASELGPAGITVNCIQPGAIETGMTSPIFDAAPEARRFWEQRAALGRIGTADEIASVALFLCSEEASFVSGHGIVVDGGAMQHS